MYASQTIECGGIYRTEYRYEPEIIENGQAINPLICAQCDYYRISNICALTGFKRQSTSLACPQVKITCPF